MIKIGNIKMLFITVFLTVASGCATSYQPMGHTGGYEDKQTGRNTFNIFFAGNGFTTPQRSTDLCMLRGAELSLTHRFNYFVIQSKKSEVDNSTSITTGNYVPIGGGGFYSGSTVAVSKPSNRMSIISFLKPPVQYKDYYDAKKIIKNIADEYYLDMNNIQINAFEEIEFFKKNDKYDFLKSTDEKNVEVIEGIDKLNNNMVKIAYYVDYETPYVDKNKLVIDLRKYAANIGADLVIYDDKYNRIQDYESNKNIAFIAIALKKLATKLGINYDRQKIKDLTYIIDSYDQNSNVESSGLLIGDRVLYIDDKEPQSLELLKSMVTWDIGKSIILTVVRNGKQIKVPLKTVSNLR